MDTDSQKYCTVTPEIWAIFWLAAIQVTYFLIHKIQAKVEPGPLHQSDTLLTMILFANLYTVQCTVQYKVK